MHEGGAEKCLDNNTYINNIYSPSNDGQESSLVEDFEKILGIYPRKE